MAVYSWHSAKHADVPVDIGLGAVRGIVTVYGVIYECTPLHRPHKVIDDHLWSC